MSSAGNNPVRLTACFVVRQSGYCLKKYAVFSEIYAVLFKSTACF